MVGLTSKLFRFSLIASLGLFFLGCGNDLKRGEKLYHEGKYQKALPILEHQCIQGETSACIMSASILSKQKGITNRLKALKALQFACKYGDTSACKMLIPTYQKTKDQEMMMQILQWGCQGGNPSLCLELGQECLKNQDSHQALKFLIKSCYGGEKRGCQIAKSILEKTNPKSSQIQELTRLSQTPL